MLFGSHVGQVAGSTIRTGNGPRQLQLPRGENELIAPESTSALDAPRPYWAATLLPEATLPYRLLKDEQMSHLSREKLDLVTRPKKAIGQLGSVLRDLNEESPYADVFK